MSEPQADLGVGATLHLSVSLPATYDEAGFQALVAGATEIVDVVNIGPGGGTSQRVAYTPLKTGVEVPRNGTITYNERTVQMGRHPTEAGHELMKSAFDGANKGKVHSAFVIFADGSIEAFTATVGSYSTEQVEANTFNFNNTILRPTDKVIEIAAPSTSA